MNPVIVRNVRIGEGMPKICVPIVDTTQAEIVEYRLGETKSRSNARSINLPISSFLEIPAASQSIGYMLIAVKPGMVLISLKITSPS